MKGKLSCSSCYEDIEEGAEVVILTVNNPLDLGAGWSGLICHKACADNMTWGAS